MWYRAALSTCPSPALAAALPTLVGLLVGAAATGAVAVGRALTVAVGAGVGGAACGVAVNGCGAAVGVPSQAASSPSKTRPTRPREMKWCIKLSMRSRWQADHGPQYLFRQGFTKFLAAIS